MRILLASRGCGRAVALPALCLTSCLPASDLASYSSEDRGTGSGLDGTGNVVAAPPVLGSGNGEGTPTIGLSPNSAADAGSALAGSFARDAGLADAAITSGCAAAGLGPSDNCYLVDTTPHSWSDARASCRALGDGWDLASLRSAQNSAFAAPLLTLEAWIGASDAALEGTWTWVDQGDAFWLGDGMGSALNGAYANWNSNEPNGAEESDCGRILPAGAAVSPGLTAPWADLSCTELRGALCEGPPS
ncbi:MAG: C-type lectin domain-containing protein [Deltaproteobacteria bacterium]